MTELATVDVLVIDDFALEPMSREESRDIYQLFVERNARLSTVVTSNRDTAERIAAFDDALLAQSAVDRFKNNAFDLGRGSPDSRSRVQYRLQSSTSGGTILGRSLRSLRRQTPPAPIEQGTVPGGSPSGSRI